MRFAIVLVSVMVLFACEKKVENTALFAKKNAIVLVENQPEIYLYWELDDADYLWSDSIGEVKALQTYRDSLKLVLGEALLQETIEKESTQELNPKNDTNDILNNYNLIHQGFLGKIKPISFAEAQLLNFQISRYPLLSHPTEFHGFILQNETTNKVRFYLGASDQPWPPKPAPIIEQVEKDLENGWKMKFHLHNHYEPKEDNYLGVMAPSKADAHYFKALRGRFHLPEARITNGFTTVVMDSASFDVFESH